MRAVVTLPVESATRYKKGPRCGRLLVSRKYPGVRNICNRPEGHTGAHTKRPHWSRRRADAPVLGTPCSICGNGADKTLHWDHDHTTGEFRGWICSPCNTALGMMKDDPDRLRKAAAYLEERP